MYSQHWNLLHNALDEENSVPFNRSFDTSIYEVLQVL